MKQNPPGWAFDHSNFAQCMGLHACRLMDGWQPAWGGGGGHSCILLIYYPSHPSSSCLHNGYIETAMLFCPEQFMSLVTFKGYQ